MDHIEAINTLIEENQRLVQKYGVCKLSKHKDDIINALLTYVHSTEQKIQDLHFSRQRFPYLCAEFSFFLQPITNTEAYGLIKLRAVFDLIRYDCYKQKTETLRAITDKKEARRYKAQNFDYVTFSGFFTKRDVTCLEKHSNMIVIDIDHIANVEEIKQKLINDDYFPTLLLFRSPSGDGLKWVIPIDITEYTHEDWFTSIANYLQFTYKLEIDKSGKDVARACFLCYDPEAYIHPILL